MATSTSRAPSKAPSAPKPSTGATVLRRGLGLILTLATVITVAYSGVSIYMAYALAYQPPKPIVGTPNDYGLSYREVTFPSRDDGVMLHGWYIPGVLPNGKLTSDRTIIMVHGTRTNRADKDAGLLKLSAQLAMHGYGILAFDMRGTGESPPAPLSLGYFEYRDVLGAVDLLRTGTPPYPELGRPRVLGGWGVSMGGSTLLLAAAREPALKSLVTDSAYAEIVPILQREIPAQGHVPAFFTPGGLVALHAIYGVDFYRVRPVDVIGRLNRPWLIIHSDTDKFVPYTNFTEFTKAVVSSPEVTKVQTWSISGPAHAQAFNKLGDTYVAHVVSFYDSTLGPDQSH